MPWIRLAQQMLKAELAAIERDVREMAHKKLAVLLPPLGLDDWGKKKVGRRKQNEISKQTR